MSRKLFKHCKSIFKTHFAAFRHSDKRVKKTRRIGHEELEKRQEREKEKGDFMDLSRMSRRRDGLEFLWSCWRRGLLP